MLCQNVCYTGILKYYVLVFEGSGESVEQRVNGDALEFALVVSAHESDAGRSLVVDLDDLRILRAHQYSALM